MWGFLFWGGRAMTKDKVRVGGTYVAKVSGKLTVVWLEGERRYGGWNARNLATGAGVRVRTAGLLRSELVGVRGITTLGELPLGHRCVFLGDVDSERVKVTPEEFDRVGGQRFGMRAVCLREGSRNGSIRVVDLGI